MEHDELKTCLAALRAGDMAAFERIYDSLNTPAYTVILRITREAALAEDILQEVFVKLYRSPPAEDVRNPRAYILQMARNLAIDSVKKQRSDASLDDIQDTAPAPERDIPLKLDVEAALCALTPSDCQIVTLHVNGGLKFREVAEIMRMPLGTVLWRYRRAVSELRMKLSGGAI